LTHQESRATPNHIGGIIRLLHVADVHLGASLSAFGSMARLRSEQVQTAFAHLPEVAEREGVHAVLCAGDLFDGIRPDAGVMALVRETVRRFAANGRPVFLVPGNHDALDMGPSPLAEEISGAQIFRSPRFGEPISVQTEAGALHVYGLAYDAGVEPDPLSSFVRSDAEGTHVILLHGSVPDAPHWSGGRALRLPIERLAALEADYVALGDHHRFRPPSEFGLRDGPPACYSGSFAAVDLTEAGPHGYVVVEIAGEGEVQVRLQPSEVPAVVHMTPVDVSGCADESTVIARIVADVPPGTLPVVTLVGQPPRPLDTARVEAELVARFGCARVKDRVRYFDALWLKEVASEQTIAGHVARLGAERAAAARDDPEECALRDRALRIALAALEPER